MISCLSTEKVLRNDDRKLGSNSLKRMILRLCD